MSKLVLHNPATAPAASPPLLEGSEKQRKTLRRVLRQATAFAVGVALIAIVEVALAGPAGVNADRNGLALRCYPPNPVDYFDRGHAVPGELERTAEPGAGNPFASHKNRDAFIVDVAQ